MKWLFCIIFILISCFLFSQEDNKTDDLIETNLNNGEDEEERLENENIIEDLIQLTNNPINVNDTTADFTLLFQYKLLTPLQAEQLKFYIRDHGGLFTPKELYAVPFISINQAKDLFPYIETEKEQEQIVSIKEQLKYSRKTLTLRNQFLIEKQRGFRSLDSTGKKIFGNKQRLYFKYRQQYKDQLSFGLLGDKDAGEEFLTGNNKQGFDFYSAHLSYKPKTDWLNQVIVGDYEVKIGQGLLQWNGFALGKGSDATSVYLKGPRLRPYTSSNEINFLRGGSVEIQFAPKWRSQIWYSNKNVDANVNQLDTLDSDVTELTSLQTSGLHRTIGEIEDKGSTKEKIIGANIDFEHAWFTAGVAAQRRKINNLLTYSNRYYQQFYKEGNTFQHASIHYSGVRNQLYFFGETAYSDNRSFATMNGIQKFFDSGIKATAVYRNYGKRYQSFYASSLSENTTINNEEGLYVGLTYSPIRNLKLQTYFDRFWFPWNRARVDQPSGGTEWFLRADYQIGNTEIELRSRVEKKDADYIGNRQPNNEVGSQQRVSNRIELRYQPNDFLYLKSRIGHTAFTTSQKDEDGFLLFQDIVYQFPKKPMKFYSRLATFYTPSFDSRVYAYENDLLYNFSVPAYYGKGVRFYGMASIEVIDQLKIWIKGGQTIFNDREVIGSGNNEIQGNTRTELKMQLQWKF